MQRRQRHWSGDGLVLGTWRLGALVLASSLATGLACKGAEVPSDKHASDAPTTTNPDDAASADAGKGDQEDVSWAVEKPARWDDDDDGKSLGIGPGRDKPTPRPKPTSPPKPTSRTPTQPSRGGGAQDQSAGAPIERNVRYNAHAQLDVFKPASGGLHPALIAIHGGGWRKGARTQYGPVVQPMTEQGYVVFAIDYRLSTPSRPTWPANLHDVRDAVRWVRTNAARYNVDPDRIAAVGESAGGHLSAMLGVYPDEPGQVSARVNAVVDFFGPAELVSCAAESRQGAGSAIAQMIGGSATQKAAEYADASPVNHVAADSAPMLLYHGTADELVPTTQSDKLAAALEAKGVRHTLNHVAGAGHVYVGRGFVYGGRNLTNEIVSFLNEAMPAH
jgi:acetyl esterase/lipase